MITAIHKLGEGSVCAHCQVAIPPTTLPEYVQPAVGEYVGVVNTKNIPPSSYRVGEHNKDKLCDGTPASEFFQASVK